VSKYSSLYWRFATFLNNRQAARITTTLNSRLSAWGRGPVYISSQNVPGKASESAGRGWGADGGNRQRGVGWLSSRKIAYSLKVKLAACCSLKISLVFSNRHNSIHHTTC
jgi:hypothetical protein